MAAAVGAVQARSTIRLRRLPDIIDAGVIEESPECREALARMKKEYVAPAEADVLWADAIVFGSSSRFSASSAEWAEYLKLLARLQSGGKLDGKVGSVFMSDPQNRESAPALSSFAATLLQLGLVVVPPGFAGESVTLQGRRTATVAGALRTL